MLLLDEATANLDIHHTLGLMGRIRKKVVKEQKTVIAVFQDINLAAMFCDELIFMKKGRLVDSGPVEHVLTEKNVQEIFRVTPKIAWQPFTRSRHVFFREMT